MGEAGWKAGGPGLGGEIERCKRSPIVVSYLLVEFNIEGNSLICTSAFD